MQLGNYTAAVRDLEDVIARDAKYDSHRAIALLAHAYAQAGRPAEADELFQRATDKSTLSETYYNYAEFLAAQQRPGEAREWAERLLANKAAMPRYLQRRERPWFRKAQTLLKRLPAHRA
jgi:Tfp pilus assembly protein PilF